MKILHASDFHLDSPFHRLSTEQALIRRRELREIPDAIVRLAQDEHVDLILLPGDLFDGQRVYPETVEALISAFKKTTIPIVIAPGNHDCADKYSPYLTAKWPNNVHIFTSDKIDSFSFPNLNCTVHGYAFTTPHRSDEPLLGFHVPQDNEIHLLCAHGEVGLGGTYGPISPQTLGSSNITYAALGHVHASSDLSWEGNTAWSYCGCPEGRGFDECGPKGVLIVTIDDNGITSNTYPLCHRQYRIESIDIDQFESSIPSTLDNDLVRIILTGESERTPDLVALRERANSKYFYVEVRDETTLPKNLWERTAEDSLTGLFLREMRKKLDSASEEDRATILLATRFGLAALEGGEDVCP